MTPDPNDRMAITKINMTYTLEDVFALMMSRGSTVTKAEGLSVFEELCLAIEQAVRDGNSVVTPLFNIQPSIRGVFLSDTDPFSAGRHQVKLRINPGKRLRQMENQIPVQRVPAEKKGPVLLHYYDAATEMQDDDLTPGGGGRITGAGLKFDEEEGDQGIYFVNTANGTSVKVTSGLLRNKPGELIFMNPPAANLPEGTYRLEVRTKRPGNKMLVTGALPYELTVS